MLGANFNFPNIRAIRLREDLRQIADLIELCFSPHIDPEGRDYIRNIRQTAGNFSGLIPEQTTPETSTLPFHGYVCVDNQRIIGNLTLILLRNREKGNYFVANVAVHPDYRGRGIGRRLTERAIRHVREHQGKQIFLQVRADNDVAIQLYRTHGFDETSRRTMWIYRPDLSATPTIQPSVQVTARQKEDWPQQKLWLQELYPKELHWNLPFRLSKLEPSFSNWINRFLIGEFQKSWSARKDGRLIGTATVERCSDVHDYCWLASSLSLEDEFIQSALPLIQRKLFFPKRLAVNYPAGRAGDSFRLSGMKELNTLIWMKLRVQPLHENLIV